MCLCVASLFYEKKYNANTVFADVRKSFFGCTRTLSENEFSDKSSFADVAQTVEQPHGKG
jgi:hypothetical protein